MKRTHLCRNAFCFNSALTESERSHVLFFFFPVTADGMAHSGKMHVYIDLITTYTNRDRKNICKGRITVKGWDKNERITIQKIFLIYFFFLTDKPADENMCQCENVLMFQNQVTEKLKSLVQNNILSCWLYSVTQCQCFLIVLHRPNYNSVLTYSFKRNLEFYLKLN